MFEGITTDITQAGSIVRESEFDQNILVLESFKELTEKISITVLSDQLFY
jgi:hypothetical protein